MQLHLISWCPKSTKQSLASSSGMPVQQYFCTSQFDFEKLEIKKPQDENEILQIFLQLLENHLWVLPGDGRSECRLKL